MFIITYINILQNKFIFFNEKLKYHIDFIGVTLYQSLFIDCQSSVIKHIHDIIKNNIFGKKNNIKIKPRYLK